MRNRPAPLAFALLACASVAALAFALYCLTPTPATVLVSDGGGVTRNLYTLSNADACAQAADRANSYAAQYGSDVAYYCEQPTG